MEIDPCPSATDITIEQYQTNGNPNETFNTSSATISTYDDGLLDGEAMAEEDRLAGRPGMQIGMDDDDDVNDEYEDGFDDGYDE